MANEAYTFAKRRGGSITSTAKYPLANAANVVPGTLLELNAGVLAVLSTGDPYGIALNEMTGDGTEKLPIEILCKDFMSATANADMSDTDIGKYFGVALDADGYHVIDKVTGATTTGMVYVTDVLGAREIEVIFTQRSSAADQT